MLDALAGKLISYLSDAPFCVLKIVCKFVSGLIQLNVVRAGHNYHDGVTINLVLDGASELGSFRPQLTDRLLNVVAHQGDRVVPWGFENLALPFAASRVHAHLARSGFEDEPARIEILSDALPSQDIRKNARVALASSE